MDEMFATLTTDELLRMLELLDMLEHKKHVKASDDELEMLAYLLKNTRST